MSPSFDLAAQNRERSIQAKNKRQAQIKRWQQLDKQSEKEFGKIIKTRELGPRAVIDAVRGEDCVKFNETVILLEASTREDFEEVKRLLDKGVSPNLSNEDGLTPLHQGCIDNSIEMCKLLLKYGANVNARDSENWTPLHAAATCGHTELCKLLIEKGADLMAVNAEGNMPYDICDHDITLDLIENQMALFGIKQEDIDKKRHELEDIMLRDMKELSMIDPKQLNLPDIQGATPLHISAANGYLKVTEFLCSKNLALNVEDKDGWLPIHVAACWGHLDIIETLCYYGANIEARTKQGNGESVFEICEDAEIQERLQEIRQDLENKREIPRLNVRRRSSTNTRRSSIRRTSIRDKPIVSWRDARLEREILINSENDFSESNYSFDSGSPSRQIIKNPSVQNHGSAIINLNNQKIEMFSASSDHHNVSYSNQNQLSQSLNRSQELQNSIKSPKTDSNNRGYELTSRSGPNEYQNIPFNIVGSLKLNTLGSVNRNQNPSFTSSNMPTTGNNLASDVNFSSRDNSSIRLNSIKNQPNDISYHSRSGAKAESNKSQRKCCSII